MKALELEAYNKLVYKEVPIPEFAPDEVLVRIKAAGICGSDVHGMDGSSGRRQPPVIMGHEASGIVEATGNQVQNWKKGDRVTFDSTIYPLDDWYSRQGMYNLSDNRKVLGVSCDDYKRNGAFAEFVNIPQHILYRIPDNVSFEQAALIEPIAVAAHAVNLTPVKINDQTVIFGTGLIGLFLLQLARLAGCGKIIAVDTDDHRLKVAEKLGADVILNPIKDEVVDKIQQETKGRGADIAFEAVGISETVKAAVHAVRKGGTVTLVGNITPHIEMPLQSVVTRQIRLQGSCAIAGEYPAVLDFLSQNKINTEAIISKVAPLSEGAELFHKLYQKEPGLMKVILKP